MNATKIETSCLLCPSCHRDFHHKYDSYLDKVFEENPKADFLEIYKSLT